MSIFPFQHALAIIADWTFTCATGISATLTGVMITKDGEVIGSIPGPITCPAAGTVALSQSGANDFQARVSMESEEDGSFGPSDCTISPPADVSSVSFDADIGFGSVSCTPGSDTDAIFTLLEPTQIIGGELLSLDTTALLLAGAQSTTWLIPFVLFAAGIGLVLAKRK